MCAHEKSALPEFGQSTATCSKGIEVRDPSEWQAQLERALHYASKLTLPNRPGRSYPREAYPRRPNPHTF